MNRDHKTLWRIIVGVLSFGFIVFLWAKKDIAGIYSSMPAEEALAMVITTIAVPLLKMAA